MVDRGIGMTAQRMAQANSLLSGKGGPLLAAPTRFLGHHVVGALVTRLGAHVELRPTEGSGVTAYVALPTTLVQQPDASATAAVT
ncbi:hypothetical protein ACWDBD_02350 [Streptomyces sp. NPDC001118]